MSILGFNKDVAANHSGKSQMNNKNELINSELL